MNNNLLTDELIEVIVRVAQWNIQAFEVFGHFIPNIEDKNTQDKMINLWAIAKQNNDDVIDLITEKPKGKIQ